MTLEASPAGRPSFVTRALNLLTKPQAEWAVIDAEPSSVKGIYLGYLAIWAAVPILAKMIGQLVFGVNFMGVSYHPPVLLTVVGSVAYYLLSLAWAYVFALIVEVMAPSFGGQKDRLQAFKVAAYVGTPLYVAGALQLFGGLGFLAFLVGAVCLAALVYALYQLYLGLKLVMKSPPDKAGLFALVVCLIGMVAGAVMFWLIGLVLMTAGLGAGMGLGGLGRFDTHGSTNGTVTVPGVGSVDVGKLDAASKAMQEQARRAQAGEAVAVAAETLGALLPAQAAGYARGEVSNETTNAGGFSGSTARATYTKGDRSFSLSITDMGSMAGLAQMADAVNVNTSRSEGSRYEKVGKVNGRMTTEEFDREAKSGKYGVMVGSRFMVEADGGADSIDDLKAAVAAVPFGRLEAMAK